MFRLLGVAGLLMSLLSVLVMPVAAQQDAPDVPTMDWDFDNVPRSFVAGPNAIYYPWVANDDDFGLGEADTSISVQNLEDRDGQIWIYKGNGNNSWTLATTAALSAYASKTFSAQQLGIDSGDGAPVAVVGFSWIGVPGDGLPWTGAPPANNTTYFESVADLSNPHGGQNGTAQVVACVANNAAGNQSPFVWTGDTAVIETVLDADSWTTGTDGRVWVTAAWDQDDLQELLNEANVDADQLINPFGGLNAEGDCIDALTYRADGISISDGMAIGGVAKMAVAGNNLPFTTSADTAVSGYNAINGLEVNEFNQWYLPIVQTNCGPGGCWNSIIRVANLADHNSAVTVRFFAADDGSGSLQTGFQIPLSLNGGQTDEINLGDYVPEGWVGSAHILSDGWVFAMVDRYKVGYDMWLTNTGSASNFEVDAQWQSPLNSDRFALFAPSVMSDWFGWNTGINVANLVNSDNNVSIQYFNLFGNATQGQSKRLAPHGMTYFYDPSDLGQNISTQDPTSDPNPGVVGSAIIWSDYPVAAAIDATKYPETSPGTSTDWFQATTYNATQNLYTFQAIPLVQKGNPNGTGATSGINILNPNSVVAHANVYWVNQSGFNAVNFGVSTITIPGYSNGFVYTMAHHNLPDGFVGAAQVISNVPVAAVSANVDYQVDGDGSVIFNAFNPCGFYRTSDPGDFPMPGSNLLQTDYDDSPWLCFFGDPLDSTGQSVTKTFVDEWGRNVSGVDFSIENDNPVFDPARHTTTNVNGVGTFNNVPVGNYELWVTGVPSGYLLPENQRQDPPLPADVFTLLQGEDEVLENELFFAQGVTKTVVLTETQDDGEPVFLAGVNVAIYTNTAAVPGTDAPVLGTVVVGDSTTDANGEFSSSLPPGAYILCIWDTDGVVDGVNVGLPAAAPTAWDADSCDQFVLAAGDDDLDEPMMHDIENLVDRVGTLDFGWPIGHTLVTHTAFTYCLILEEDAPDGAFVRADVEDDLVQCADLPANFLDGNDEHGVFFTGVPAGTYVLLSFPDNSMSSTTMTYDPAFDVAIDGTDDDIEPAAADATHGVLNPGAMFDFRGPPSAPVSGYVLTVTAPLGAQVQHVTGPCGADPGAPGAGALLVTTADGVEFNGMAPNADLCIQVFDSAGDFIGQFDHTFDGDGATADAETDGAVDFIAHSILTVVNWIDCGSTSVGNYGNATITPGGFDPTLIAGIQAAGPSGVTNVCGVGGIETIQSTVSVYEAPGYNPAAIIATHAVDVSATVNFLLPHGDTYAVYTTYHWGPLPTPTPQYQQNNVSANIPDFVLPDDGFYIEWLLVDTP